MEKIILSNLQEFNLIPMGISEDTEKKRRSFKFTSVLTYEQIKTIFSDSANLTSIDHALADDSKVSYMDCVGIKGLSLDFGVQIDVLTVADVYTVTLSTSIVEKELEIAKQGIISSQLTLDSAVGELTIMIASIFSMMG